MNQVSLLGRLVRDPELKSTKSGVSVCSFTLAVDRKFKNANGEMETDFIPIVTWRQTADFVAKYFQKGIRVALVGTIQVRSWDDKEGNKRYTTEVIANDVYFADSKSSNASNGDSRSRSTEHKNEPDDYCGAPEDDTALPFDL